MFRVLLIDDDPLLIEQLGEVLSDQDFSVTKALTKDQALSFLDENPFDVIVCDYELSPTENGIDIVRYMRSLGVKTPVLILTSKDLDTITPWEALDSGCDDFLRKPYIPNEIVSRLNALIRRSVQGTIQNDILHFEGITLNMQSREVLVDGQEIRLGKILFLLLYRFLKNPYHAQSFEQLIEYLWGESALFEQQSGNALRVHVHHLKTAIKPYSICIKNIYGYGYELVDFPRS